MTLRSYARAPRSDLGRLALCIVALHMRSPPRQGIVNIEEGIA